MRAGGCCAAQERIDLRKDVLRQRRAGAGGGTGSRGAGARHRCRRDAALLAALKALRLEIARDQGQPAYVVFADRTLLEMAAHRPRTPDADARALRRRPGQAGDVRRGLPGRHPPAHGLRGAWLRAGPRMSVRAIPS